MTRTYKRSKKSIIAIIKIKSKKDGKKNNYKKYWINN